MTAREHIEVMLGRLMMETAVLRERIEILEAELAAMRAAQPKEAPCR